MMAPHMTQADASGSYVEALLQALFMPCNTATAPCTLVHPIYTSDARFHSAFFIPNTFPSCASYHVPSEIDQQSPVATQPISAHHSPSPLSPIAEENTSNVVRIQRGSVHTTSNLASTNQPCPCRLTNRILAKHERTFNHLLHAAQTIVKAMDVQKAAKDLGVDLPVHCYMNDRSQLDGWIQQQSK
jgi:hypothetical protein